MKTAASYEITKIRVTPAGGKLEELEINGEAVDLGDKTVQDNKEATIDASTYTEPVEVTPSSGKTSMKKVTVTVSNIPELEFNKAATIDVSTYTEAVEITPTSGKDGMEKATVTLSNIPSGGSNALYAWKFVDEDDPSLFQLIYTATETPTTSDKAYQEGDRITNSGIVGAEITAVTETTITTSGYTWTRDATYDINPLWK